MAQQRRTFLKGLAAFGALIGIPSTAQAEKTLTDLLRDLKKERRIFRVGISR